MLSALTFFGVLPRGHTYSSAAEADQIMKVTDTQGSRRHLRPFQLLRTTFDAARNDWSSEAAHNALQAESTLHEKRSANDYVFLNRLLTSISLCGFLGTVLGISQALGVIDENRELTIAYMNVAFDTTMIGIVLTLALIYLVGKVEQLDHAVLLSATKRIENEFVVRIRPRRPPKPRS